MEFLKSQNPVVIIIKGILISFLATIILLTIFSCLLVYTELSEETIKPVILTVTGVSILIGSSICTRKLKKNGLINGAIIGGTYMLLLYLISSGINSNFSLNIMSIIMIVIRSFRRNLRWNNRSKYQVTKTPIRASLLIGFYKIIICCVI